MADFGLLLAGITLLLVGGAFMVRGASELATGLGVSPMIVGLTVVGFGTSAPELVVNIIGAVNGQTELAFGNVVGSNIANLALVLGAAAVMKPIVLQGELVRREVPLLLLATTAMTVMVLDAPLEGRPAVIGRGDSLVLMLLFCIFIYINVLDYIDPGRKDPLLMNVGDYPLIAGEKASGYSWTLTAVGCVMLFFGGKWAVDGAVGVAGWLGIPTAIIGLFVVAVGTSLPELVTSVIAAMRNESDLAVGNVVGSNLFNSLIVLPVSGVIARTPVPSGGIGDLLVSWFLVAMLFPIFFLRNGQLGRSSGVALLLAYAAYATVRVAGGAD